MYALHNLSCIMGKLMLVIGSGGRYNAGHYCCPMSDGFLIIMSTQYVIILQWLHAVSRSHALSNLHKLVFGCDVQKRTDVSRNTLVERAYNGR